MTTLSTKELKAVAKVAGGRARIAGEKAVARLVAAADTALIQVGRAAQQRQRKRASKTALKAAGKAALVLGTAAGAVAATRAAVLGVRRRKAATA